MSNKRPWNRDQKLTLTSVVISVPVLLIIPAYLWLRSYLNRPQISIISPANYTTVANNTFSANGTARGSLGDGSLWLVVESGSQQEWYPYAPLVVSNGTWSTGSLYTGTGSQKIQVWLVPAADGAILYTNKGSDTGISAMPTGAVLEAQSQVTVP